MDLKGNCRAIHGGEAHEELLSARMKFEAWTTMSSLPASEMKEVKESEGAGKISEQLASHNTFQTLFKNLSCSVSKSMRKRVIFFPGAWNLLSIFPPASPHWFVLCEEAFTSL